jgi:hypothetical protein
MPEEQSYIFTFGFAHVHPITGESLANCYVRVPGNIEESRDRMFASIFGRTWGFQYPTEEAAGVEKWGLTEIPFVEGVPDGS